MAGPTYEKTRCTWCGGLTSIRKLQRNGCCGNCAHVDGEEPDLEHYSGRRPSTVDFSDYRYNGTGLEEIES